MKQSLFRWLNTFILISALAVNLLPSFQIAAASDQDNPDVSQNNEDPIGEQSTGSLPVRSELTSPLAGPFDDCVGFRTAAYRPAEAPNPSVPTTAPSPRGFDPGFEYQFQWNDVPPVDVPPFLGDSVDPENPTSQWQETPPENEAFVYPVFRNRAVPTTGPLNDVRRDAANSFRVTRGEQIQLLIWLRNNTEAVGTCTLPRQSVYFQSIDWSVYDRTGLIGAGTISDPTVFWITGGVNQPVPATGEIPETALAEGNNASSDIYTLIDFTIPETAQGFINVVVNGLQFCLDATCSAGIQSSAEYSNFVDVIGGPLATAEVKLVGGDTGRSAGENAWFVIELTSLLGAVDLKDPVIQTVTDKGATLPECRTTSSTPPANGRWYKFPFVPDFATIESADPGTFDPAVGNTAYNYNTGAPQGPTNDIFDMNLRQTQKAYCAFRKTLLPDASGNFVLDAELEVTGYPAYPGAPQLKYTVPISKVVPIGSATIRVDKEIIGPLVQPPEIDPNTGQPRVKTIVNIGETVTYRITVTNVGDVDLNNVSLIDSLIGPYTFPPADVLHPEDSPGNCPVTPCSASITLTYTVAFTDPNPIQNVVEARARIVGTTFQVVAQDVASILKAESELQLVLTADPAPGGDGFQPGEIITYNLQYCNTGTADLSSVEFLSGYPTRFDPGTTPGTLRYAQPGYPIVRNYLDDPPIITSFSAPPFLAGTCGTIRFNYTIPNFGDPTFRDPIFQDIRMRAVRQDSTIIFGDAKLVTPLTNNNVSIDAVLWDPVTLTARPDTTVLRGENLMFDLNVTNLSETQRCNVLVKMYTLNTITGVETLIQPDLPFNWPAIGDRQLGRLSENPNNIANTLPNAGDPPNIYRPQYQVDGASPDPLVIIFEVDARTNCAGGPPQLQFIARKSLVLDVTDVQIATTLEIRNRTTNARVTQGFYPVQNDITDYMLFLSATNVGPATMTITRWSYCIVGSPIGSENCTSPTNEIDMFDGSSTQGLPGTTYPDFGVDSNFSLASRQFTTLQNRTDRRAFDLLFGENYPNPLTIQIIIRGTDNKGTNVTVRDTVILPLITGNLNLSLDGPSTLVRGDFDVPITFAFAKGPSDGTLTDVRVLNLMEQDDVNGVSMPPGLGFGSEKYELCTYSASLGGGTVIATIPDADTGVKTGTCSFTFSNSVPTVGEILEFRAAVIATQQSSGLNLVDVRILEITVIPHLVVLKSGLQRSLKSDRLPYTIIVTNQSAYQYVDFPSDGFEDEFSPIPDGQICKSPGDTPCPPTILDFSPPFQTVAGGYRLAPNGSSSLSYNIIPPAASGEHGADGYNNIATFTGNRQFDTAQVSASDSHSVILQCPIEWQGFFLDADPGTTSSDSLYTLGEAITILIQGYNLGQQDITFTSFQDLRFELDGGIPMTLSSITWPGPEGILPAAPVGGLGQPLSYTLTVFIRPTDYLALTPGENAPDANNGPRGAPVVGDATLRWRMYYTTTLDDQPGSRPCYDSVPTNYWFWFFDIPNPVRVDKIADTALAFTGQTVTYSISAYNISEAVGMVVDSVEDNLLGSSIIMNFPSGSTGTSGLLPVSSPPAFAFSQGPLTHTVQDIDPRELINIATVNYHPDTGGPSWLYNPPEAGVTLVNQDSARVVTENPLKLTKLVVVPTTGVAPRGGVVEYQITLINDSAYPVTGISLTDSRLAIPTCAPPGLVPPRCLDNPSNFTLGPGAAVQVIIQYTIPQDEPGPTVVNTATAQGTLIIEGVATALPPAVAQASVSLTEPAITMTVDIYSENTCTTKLVDVTFPIDRDRDDDGVPEANVSELVYYRFDIFAGGGKTFKNVLITANLQNGDASLTNNTQDALENHPNVTQPDTMIADNIAAPPEQPEVTLCMPYVIQNREPDPLVLLPSITGLEVTTNLQSTFNAPEVPLDVGDPNVFISKTTDRIVAFPGQEVTYTILIENKSGHPLRISDVYDERLGGQLFFDHDSNPATPPVEGDFWRDNTQTSINFFTPNQATDGEGWAWPGTIGLLQPGESVTYRYTKTILNTDPDPLLNRAGVIAVVQRPEGDVDAQDETLNSLAVTNSQLRVTKTVVPTTTILGNTVTYSIAILNIGDTPVYDIVITDNRYELQYGTAPNTTQLEDGVNGVAIIGGDTCNGSGTNNDLGPVGAVNPCSGDPIVATYSLPTIPTCVRWIGTTCDTYDPGNPASDLPYIDPFVNTAVATGFVEDPNAPGTLIALDPPGSDTAIVDLINPGIRVEKIASVGGAPIGSDVEYTVRVVNTGDVYIRVDEVIDVPNANIPGGPTVTTELPITQLFFEDCPVPAGIQTVPAGVTNLENTRLRPFSVGGIGSNPSSTPIQVDNTAILLPGCSAIATITVEVPNPFPNNEYVNVVQVSGVDGAGANVSDLSSAEIDIRSAGIEISKRAWNCDTTPIGSIGNVPNSTGCTVTTPPSNAQPLAVQDEGRFVYYELTLVNSGTDAFDQLIIRDEMLVAAGGGSYTPNTTLTIPNGTPYYAIDYRTNGTTTYFWNNGALVLTDLTPGVPGDGPFGFDDPTTPSVDESNLFEPGEAFVRLDPGPLVANGFDPGDPNDRPDEMPAITYRHAVRLPQDVSETLTNPDGTPRINYLNRATVTGSSSLAGVTPISNSDQYLLEVRPAQLGVQVEACVDEDGNPATAHVWTDPCITVAQVEDALGNPQPAYIWYRITLTNNSDTITMREVNVTDTVRGNIPTADLCWQSNPGGSWNSQGVLPSNASVECIYVRDDSFTPLTTADDPYTNTVTATFKIDSGTPPLLDGNPGTGSATVRIASGALLLTIVGCEDTVFARGGQTLNFSVIVENVSPTDPINNIEIFSPDPNTGQPTQIAAPPAPTTLTAGQSVTIPNGLRVIVPQFGQATNEYRVSGFGAFLLPTNIIQATASCTVQRITSDLAVTKTVINPVRGNATAAPGDTVTYTITIENLGASTIEDLTVSDPRLQAVVPPASWDWPITLQAAQSVSRTYNYVVPAGEDPILNTVTVQGLANGITPISGQDDAQLAISDGDIVVSVNAVPNPVFAGGTTTFNYEICNLSTTINYAITTLDESIIGLTTPVTSSLTDTQGNPVTLPLNLNGLQCRQFVHTVTTESSDANATITATLYAEGHDSTCDPATNPGCPTAADSQNVDVQVIDPTADILVEIDADRPTVISGDTVQFTLRVTNIRSSGNVALDSLTDTLGLFTGSTAFAGQTLAPFASRTLTLPYAFTGTPDPLFEEVTVNYTVVSSGLTGNATDSISIPVVAVAGASLVVQISAPSTSTPGADLTYRYDVTNISGATVTDGYVDGASITPPPGCTTLTPNDWAVGGPANLIPPMPIGMTRSATVICRVDPAFPINTDISHFVEVHRTGAAPTTLQDNDTRIVRIVPPLELTIQQVNLAVPGGYAYLQYTVTNIGPTPVNNVSLTFNTPDLPTCNSTQASGSTTWIANPFGTDTGLDLLPVGAATQNFAIGETLVATLGCYVPVTFLDGPPPVKTRDFVHNGAVTIDAAPQDSAAVTATVIQPIEFTLLPQNTPADVTIPTTPGVAPTFLRAGDTTRLVFRLRNIGPPGFTATGVDYDIIFTNQNGSPLGTLFCATETVLTSWGGPFTNQLTNPGDYIDIVCEYRPLREDAGLVKVLSVDVTHRVGANDVVIPVPNPLMTATVEYLELSVQLIGQPNTQGSGESRVDDGDPVQYTLIIRNNGSVPLSTFQFTQSQIDLETGQTVAGTTNFLTPDAPPHTLTDLWNANRDPNGARCPDPLGPGQSCTISGAIVLHLIRETDLNHIVVTTDPNRFEVRVFGEARSTTASGFTATGTSSWRTVVQRPIIRLGGPLSSVNKDQNGNVWIWVPTYLTWEPNPAQMNQEVTFKVQIENAGFKNIFTPSLNGVINLLPTAADDGIALTSAGYQTTPLASLSFDIPTTTLRRGEITTATATWEVSGVTPPTVVYLRLNFQADVEGNYPDYNIVSPPIPVPIVADPTAATTDPDGNPLDPNATEPTITKTASVESASPGEPVSWTIQITNGSTNPMNNITMVDAVPGELEIVSATTSRGASIVTGNLIEVTVGTLGPGERATITINTNIALTAAVPSIITNTAVASREGGDEISAEASVGVGTVSDANPATGAGFIESTGVIMPASGLLKHLPFAVGIFSVFFFMLMLNVSITNRQRIILAVLALGVVALLIGGLLLLASGEEETPPPTEGTPIDEAQVFATATPIPTEIAVQATSTPEPTVPPQVLATIQSFPPTATPYILPTQAGPRRLDIPVLNYSIPVPIVELPLINNEWDVSNLGHNVGWLDKTTWFDTTWGNTVLVGHIQLSNSEPGPFQKLDRLAPGDEVFVYEGDLVRKFTVTEIFTVGAAETEVTYPTNDPVLTLMTCTNWDDSRGIFSDRLVVRAVPAGEEETASDGEEDAGS
ncbi:MAG: DUF11 domain-containing protein [Anaerolineae bacterium]|nr:DUF11 domain-containing protein [Anaerolineae bacterium]